MDLKCKMIMEEYKEQKSSFTQLGDVVHTLLQEALDKRNIVPLAIEHRVKTEKSLAGKLELKGDKYSTLADITDILGARIICFFSDEVDKIAEIVQDNFDIDWENSVDKRAIIKPDAFGYLSLHYICSLPMDSEYPDEICGKKFEIQIRTNLQHTWAVINHDLGYKTKFGVPRRVTRNFSRIASILEIADEQFVQIRDDIADYEDVVTSDICNDRADGYGIDNNTLNSYIELSKQMNSFMQELSELCDNAEISAISAEPYIEQLAFLGITTLGDLNEMLKNNKETALKLASRMLENTDLDILSSNVGLRFLCRAELINKNYSFDDIVKFMEITVGEGARAERQAKRVLSLAKEL